MKLKPLFAGMTIVLLTSILFAQPKPGDFFAAGPQDQKKMALSFDDGPGPNTEAFLDLLDQYKVKGTFFVSGRTG